MKNEAHKIYHKGNYRIWLQYWVKIWGLGIKLQINPPWHTKRTLWQLEINLLCFNIIIDRYEKTY